MKPFRFPLQRVLDVKNLLEEQQRIRFAQARRRVDAAEEKLTFVAAVRAEAVAGGNDQSIASNPLLRGMNWRERSRLQQLALLQKAKLDEERRRLDEERSTLMVAHKERRSLELLRDNQGQRHRKDEQRRQQNVVDELFVARFGRFGREDGDE